MNIVSRNPKTWPYAQNSEQDSVGKLLGTLHPGLLGDILCWEARGEARRLFESDLKKSVLDFLHEHSDKAQDSGSYLSIPLFMVGKRAKRAKPVVMLVSDDKVARKEAYDLIVQSDIMTKYPGFELGHSDFDKLMAWTGELVYVFSPGHKDASECYRLTSISSHGSGIQKATAGGVVSYNGEEMLLTVGHFLKNSQPMELPAYKAGASQFSDCEITGLGDFDDDDDDDDTDEDFVETTRQGSISDVDDSRGFEIDDPYTPGPASESDQSSQRQSSTSLPESHVPLSPERFFGRGKCALYSEELDYAIFKVYSTSRSASLSKNAISLENMNQIEPGPRSTAVKTVTPGGGTIRGHLSENTLPVRLPQSKTFIEIYTAKFFGLVGPGDCGCFVKDEVTGRLFGHVFAGNLASGLTAIMPATLVFHHARAELDWQLQSAKFLKSYTELQEPEPLASHIPTDGHDSTHGSIETEVIKPSPIPIRKIIPSTYKPKGRIKIPAYKRPSNDESFWEPEIIPSTYKPRSRIKTPVYKRLDKDESSWKSEIIHKYVCRDPAEAGVHSDLAVIHPLAVCQACSSGKQYDKGDDALAHLRQVHFGQGPSREQPALTFDKMKQPSSPPPSSKLRAWLEQITVKTDKPDRSPSTDDHTEDHLPASTDKVSSDAGGLFQPLPDAFFIHTSVPGETSQLESESLPNEPTNFGIPAFSPTPQDVYSVDAQALIPPSFSNSSALWVLPPKRSYYLWRETVNLDITTSNSAPQHVGNTDNSEWKRFLDTAQVNTFPFLLNVPWTLSLSAENVELFSQDRLQRWFNSSAPSEVAPTVISSAPSTNFTFSDATYFSSATPPPSLPPSNRPSAPVAMMKMDGESHSAAPMIKPQEATNSRSNESSNSDLSHKTYRVFCNACNDHPDGFLDSQELHRHYIARHTDKATLKRFICQDPNYVNDQAIEPLSKCEACLAQTQYTSPSQAIAHLLVSHISGSDWPQTEELKAWVYEVQVDMDRSILSYASTSADAGGGSPDLDHDEDQKK